MTKKTRVVLVILFFLGGIFGVSYYYFSLQSPSYYTEEIVSESSDKIKSELKDFLRMALDNINYFKDEFKINPPDSLNNASLNRYFSDELASQAYISAVVLAGKNKQYVFGKDNDSWLSTYDQNLDDSITTWHRYDKDLNEISSWQDVYGIVLPKNTLQKLKKTDYGENGVWVVLKGSSEERDDALMNFVRVVNNNNETFVMGFVYPIKNLKKRIDAKNVNANILLAIISKNNVIYIPFIDPSHSVDSNGVRLTSKISKLIDGWRNSGLNTPQIFSFPFSNKSYWSKIDTINAIPGILAYDYTTRESDLVKGEKEKDRRIIFLAIFSFILAFLFGFVFKKKEETNEQALALKPLTKPEISAVLKNGETEIFEFKSSLRWDYREEKVNPILENVIIKTIAAFANAKGGYLIIGVDDDGQVLGLENDYNTFKKQTLDYFELHIRKIINNQFGIAYTQTMLTIEFPKTDGKNICVITINPSNTPRFINLKNKDGVSAEKFYVRVGNASHEISSLEEMNDYMTRRFKNS